MPIYRLPERFERTKSEEKFERLRRNFIAKHGYTITVPGITDIIKIPLFEPMSDEEKRAWKRKDRSFFTARRWEDIRAEKQRRKERYIHMMSSPQPQIFRKRAEIVTAIDNAQDATSTLAVLATVATKMFPRIATKSVLGPIGWLMTASNMMRAASTIVTPEMQILSGKIRGSGRSTKKRLERMKKLNHSSTTIRINNSKAFKLIKKGRFDIVQGAQVTQDVFGFGLVLGGLMSLPLDIIFGSSAYLKGQKVNIKLPVPQYRTYELIAMKTVKGALNMLISPFTDANDLFTNIFHGLNSSLGILNGIKWLWNSVDRVSNPLELEMTNSNPKNFLTDEAIQEEHKNSKSKPEYTTYDQDRKTLEQLLDIAPHLIKNKLDKFFIEHQYDHIGFDVSQQLTESTLSLAQTLSDDGKVTYDTKPSVKFIIDMLDNDLGFAKFHKSDLTKFSEKRLSSLDHNLDIYNYKEALSIVTGSRSGFIIPYNIKSRRDHAAFRAVLILGIKDAIKLHHFANDRLFSITLGKTPDQLRKMDRNFLQKERNRLNGLIRYKEIEKKAFRVGVFSNSTRLASIETLEHYEYMIVNILKMRKTKLV